ncbi:unnamed protein product, partial [Sphagnum jensenii]
NSKDHVNTLLSTSLNNPMQIGSQKMGFPFLVVFQLGHNTTNPHILNIQWAMANGSSYNVEIRIFP